MIPDYNELCQSLGMTEIIRLQSMLSLALHQRFERKAAVAFSDIVGSTQYFASFGDEAGRGLQQRHVDLVQRALAGSGGRVVDTAGDGAFLCFPDVDSAIQSLVTLMRLTAADNADRERDEHLAIRIGIHHGSVLTDGVLVTGEVVNICARVAASADPGEIRLTRDAFHACVDTRYRSRCRALPPATVKGVTCPLEVLSLCWHEDDVFPTRVRFDTGEQRALPDRDVISFGRLREGASAPANDIVLQCADPTLTRAISRWHFQLVRRAHGFAVRALADAPTEVNGRVLAKGEEVPIWPGDSVRVSKVLTLWFEAPDNDSDHTILAADSGFRRALQNAGLQQTPRRPTAEKPRGDEEPS